MMFEHNEMNLDGSQTPDPSLQTPPSRPMQRMTLTLGAGGPVMSEPSEVVPDDELVIPANINRNAPCPCGSGLKYKQCHGKIA